MSHAAFSLKVFAGYLLILGGVLLIAPNVLLTLFAFAATLEVWIRVLAIVVINLAVYYWFAGKSEARPFLRATVYTRAFILFAFAALVVLGLARPTLILFGVIDALGGIWTFVSLRRDEAAA
jgi:hypothetical protein